MSQSRLRISSVRTASTTGSGRPTVSQSTYGVSGESSMPTKRAGSRCRLPRQRASGTSPTGPVVSSTRIVSTRRAGAAPRQQHPNHS
jgi:hypothetical protein